MPLIVTASASRSRPPPPDAMRCLSFSISRSSAFCSASSLSTRCATSNGGALSRSPVFAELVLELAQVVERARAGDRLDAAHALRDAGLAEDLEQADVAGAAHVGAAAELDRLAADRDDAHRVAVLLAEHRDRAALLAPPRSAAPRRRESAFARISALTRSSTWRFCSVGHRREVREVEAQAIGRDERALLRDVIAEHLLERVVQEVRRRVVRADPLAARRRRPRTSTLSPTASAPVVDLADQHVHVAGRLLGVVDRGPSRRARDHRAGVADLAAATRRRTASGRTRARPSRPARRVLDALAVDDDRLARVPSPRRAAAVVAE